MKRVWCWTVFAGEKLCSFQETQKQLICLVVLMSPKHTYTVVMLHFK